MASYATPADLYKRHDIRLIQDLCQDDGVRPTRPAMLTDDIVEELLADASGDIELALLNGGKYTVDQLEALTGNSLQMLKRMTCDIGMAYLFDRRPTYKPEQAEKYRDVAERSLERLRKGENVFNLAANIEAGIQTIQAAQLANYEFMNLTVDQVGSRFYPPRYTRLANGQAPP